MKEQKKTFEIKGQQQPQLLTEEEAKRKKNIFMTNVYNDHPD